ncbi:aspartyl-phosphate phosphatase Spo0E family protein [Alicyclobacillus acidoterrestris]|uniref:Aspartyl-phosphate phosphatase Spo0E family protein n=1 Tax=Alicyclobacillus acidoterrestris (strain ATCC 49025 / DSM 3922 / CIP 106132 / NCIMB 13137 / GD3B) TaxID=1356854 RepID=T0BR97_ALIAG|nr:aspartyl-phosphate phosphatase Spo0E family protein [Alicyclobacillus acidoterrestris]EPZ43314.1 hypothetical protein N007_13530 [Alicyclobacillus acidoterrestris ATCC 49025]UNO47729.1 aspartyl-phosphate phosphatase Spo0E family protein [Alicyclobacillus acidoterrestris]GEO27380.1 hypothetical protein AAC03nite_31650 [Alicyclobacillus acidoterrestris]
MTNGDTRTISVIEYLRNKMILRAQATGDLLHQDVIQLSQQLDRFLVQDQRHRAEAEAAPRSGESATPSWPQIAAGNEPRYPVWLLRRWSRRHLRMVGGQGSVKMYKQSTR